jgi:hypothetical protein
LHIPEAAQVWTKSIHEQNVCSFSNVTVHQNKPLLFTKL